MSSDYCNVTLSDTNMVCIYEHDSAHVYYKSEHNEEIISDYIEVKKDKHDFSTKYESDVYLHFGKAVAKFDKSVLPRLNYINISKDEMYIKEGPDDNKTFNLKLSKIPEPIYNAKHTFTQDGMGDSIEVKKKFSKDQISKMKKHKVQTSHDICSIKEFDKFQYMPFSDFEDESTMVVYSKPTIIQHIQEYDKMEVKFQQPANPNKGNGNGIKSISYSGNVNSFISVKLNFESGRIKSIKGLPPGLEFDSTDDSIKGVPIDYGNYNCTAVTNNGNQIDMIFEFSPLARIL